MTSYTRIFEDRGESAFLRPQGAPFVLKFTSGICAGEGCRLFFAGESAITKFWKNEPDFPWQYHTVTDSLNTEYACRSQYCLDFSSEEPATYTRRVFREVDWPPLLSYLWSPPVGPLKLGIRMRSEDFAVADGGYMRMALEVRLRKPGVCDGSVDMPPDFLFRIDLAEDTAGEWKEYSLQCDVPVDDIAHIGVLIEGREYSGRVYFEKPVLFTGLGWNLLPEFCVPVPDKQKFDWTAQYLSRKEWPRFLVTLDGDEIFCGEIFERCHLNSEWEIAIPPSLGLSPGEHSLSVSLLSSYHDPLPYTIHEIGLISQPAAKVNLVAASSVGVSGGFARLLFETLADDVEIGIVSGDPRLTGGRYRFAKAGLHGVLLPCSGAETRSAPLPTDGCVADGRVANTEAAGAGPAKFTVICDGVETEGEIGRIVLRQADGVVTGTGDMVYVHQDICSFREYIKWYLENEVGDLVTARPTYRWSGSRTLDREAWREFTRVLNELGMEYVHIRDGRELPGQNANPDGALLAGSGFRGDQLHERDGVCFYLGIWSDEHSRFIRQLWQMQQREYDEDPEHSYSQYKHGNYFIRNGSYYWHRDPEAPRDFRGAHDMLVAQLAFARGAILRHTGPSVMFKYMLEAGYRWVGYESMYAAIELYMAFLRGASVYGGVDRPGVHHALQWSSSPHDAPEHSRRFRLALYSAYIQGACEVNTEEGLWHIEEYYSGYNRFGEVCRSHLRQQQDFYKYVRTHTRRGKFRTPLALLHGRYDGWIGFCNKNPWGINGLELSGAEKSWDLLKVFYPLSKPGEPVYRHYCPDDREEGFFTGTPMGPVDVVPVEAKLQQMAAYRSLVFLGYNCAGKETLDTVLDAVKGGSSLLLTRAHLSVTTSCDDILAGRLVQIDHPLAFVSGEPQMRQCHFNGADIEVCENILTPDEVVAATDDGLPLLCRYKTGKGSVTLLNAFVWPSDPCVRELYEAEIREMMVRSTAMEKVWCECGDDVEFAVYEREDGMSDVYLLASDWYRDPAKMRRAVLRAGSRKYEIEFPFGRLVKAVVKGETAVWADSEEREIIAIEGERVVYQ